MKILEAFGEPISNGGQEAFVMNLLDNLNKKDVHIDLLTPYYCDNDYYQEKVEKKGGRIVALNERFNPGKLRFNIYVSVDKFLNENKYDVIHIHSGSISIFGILSYLAKKNGVKKIIVHSHAAIEKPSLKNKFLKKICNLILKDTVDIYCACSKIAGHSKFVDAVVNKKLIIIKNGIDIEKFKFNKAIRTLIRNELNIGSKFVVGHVGRFSYEKNHDFLIDVFYEVQKITKDSLLILIGSGDLENTIKNKIKKLGIIDKVVFIGNVNNVYDYYQAMDCFVFPSLYEGLGIAAIEAQAAGLKTYMSDVIPDETQITDLVRFISLKKEPKYWAKKILEGKNYERKDMSLEIKDAGYDIKSEIREIEEIYLKD